MPSSTRDIKRRIRAIGNTKKITKAMELVAASKMRRAVQSVLATRKYANTAWGIVQELAKNVDPESHPLLMQKKSVSSLAVLLIVSNRGLAGSFHRDLVDEAARVIAEEQKMNPSAKAEIVLVGKKGKDIYTKYHFPVIAEFEKKDAGASSAAVRPMAKIVIDDFSGGKYDKVVIVYTDYISSLKQAPRSLQLLPLTSEDKELGMVTQKDQQQEVLPNIGEYIFEPSADEVFDAMLYRLIELQIFQALLESNASEHSARMISMRNASDAASDMIDAFTLLFNQARQAAITTELADISGGRAALE